jgi:hypothetical protein
MNFAIGLWLSSKETPELADAVPLSYQDDPVFLMIVILVPALGASVNLIKASVPETEKSASTCLSPAGL